jgi:hypothetical protein
MNEWLKSHTYISEWLSTVAEYIAIFLTLSLAAYPVIKKTVTSLFITFYVWLMLGLVLVWLRLTMSQETSKEMMKNLLLIGCMCIAFQSTLNELKATSDVSSTK